MKETTGKPKTLTRLMFRLLPVQILIAAVASINSIVSGYFASNYIGTGAMAAVGLFGPLGLLITAVTTALVSGAVILAGKYMGENRQEELQNVFSLSIVLTLLISGAFAAFFAISGSFGLTGFLTNRSGGSRLLNQYMIGQALAVCPMMLGNLLSSFLSMENQNRRMAFANAVYVAAHAALNCFCVCVFRLETFGLALASALSACVYLAAVSQHFMSGRSLLRIRIQRLKWDDCGKIVRIGSPGALGKGYETVLGLFVNYLIIKHVGNIGISAITAARSGLAIFWSVHTGMLAVSRLMFSVSFGEEDRKALADTMRVVFKRYLPVACAVTAVILLSSGPITRIFYRDEADPVFQMARSGLCFFSLCLPMNLIYSSFICYGQVSGRQDLVHLLSLLDGLVCVAVFTGILIPYMGMDGVYTANVLSVITTVLAVVVYAWVKTKRFPKTMEDLLALPDTFGVPQEQRMDLSVRTEEEVVTVSRKVQEFCTSRGVDSRRSFLAALALEEITANIVEHGFSKGHKNHSADVCVVCKGDEVILRTRDDCIPFDPGERLKMAENGDLSKNIGIRLVFGIARDVQYQNILGLNVLMIWI